MDGKQFDRIVRSLATNASRRGVLGGGIATLAALVTRRGSAADKVTICHFTSSLTNPYEVITVSVNAFETHHVLHGDFAFGDCCLDEECADFTDQCNIGVCDSGTCVAQPTPGVTCDDGDPCTHTDTCTTTGTCVGTELDCSEFDDQCNVGTCADGECFAKPTPDIACDDSNACTEGDTCNNDGDCVGTPLVCDDGDVCTTDSCDPATGCVFKEVVCPVEETCCKDTGCTNLASDEKNCRECGRVCPDGFVCCEGICTAGTCLGICDRPIVCEVSSQDCGPEEFACLCGSTIEGGFGCGDRACTDVSCTSSSQCVAQFGIGAFCETESCCGVNECVMPCGVGSATIASVSGRTRGSLGS